MTAWSDTVWIHAATYLRLSPPEREKVCQEMVDAGDYPDLDAAATDMLARAQFDKEREEAGIRQREQRIEREKREQLARAQVLPGPCTYCGAPDAKHIDHVIPKSRGGPLDDPGNLVRACGQCNPQKRNRTVDEWREWRLARGLSWPPAWDKPGGGSVGIRLPSGQIRYPYRPKATRAKG